MPTSPEHEDMLNHGTFFDCSDGDYHFRVGVYRGDVILIDASCNRVSGK